jgi:transposase
MELQESKRKGLDKEFKREAVLQVVEKGRRVSEVASGLGVSENSLYKWLKQYREDPANAFPGKGYLTPEAEELRQLRKRLADVTEERDILKKAVAIFSKIPNRNTGL